jgi:hypothetical protein
MCVGGPPKPTQPSRVHSRPTVASETRESGGDDGAPSDIREVN